MTGMFSPPQKQVVYEPPPPPGQDPAALAAQDAATLAATQRQSIGGRASTQLTGDLGETDRPKTASKRLLGQ